MIGSPKSEVSAHAADQTGAIMKSEELTCGKLADRDQTPAGLR